MYTNADSSSAANNLLKQETAASLTTPLKDRVFIKVGDCFQKMLVDDLLFISSDHVYITLHTSKRRFLIRDSLQHFLAELNSENFMRVHRSFAVNLQKVDTINHNYLMIGEDKILLSKKYRDGLLSRFHIK